MREQLVSSLRVPQRPRLRECARVTRAHDGKARVLVATRDLVGAGLVGALVDGMGAAPVFPVRGESVAAAIRRLSPDCLVIEASHPAARAAETYDTATTAGLAVIVFAPSHPWGAVADIVHRRPGVTLVWPRDGESLAERLEFALGAACARPRVNASE